MDPSVQGTILADALLIDRLVQRFERAWRDGENPTIEAFLKSLPSAHHVVGHERLLAAQERLGVEAEKRDAESESLAATYLHVTSQGDTKNSGFAGDEASVPTELGAFQIERELGRGAFGIVYQALDSRLDRQVAIKVPLLNSAKLQQQYIDEARKAAKIERPGIVPIYHVDVTEDGSPYVVQKFIDGPNLRELLKRVGGIGLLPALSIVREVARALAAAHRSGMIHRDLKPENILIDSEGKPWIADFGLALREDEQDGRDGEVAGTPLYMSPEQVRGKADWLDGRTDIWAVGVLMYELIAGRPPFAAKSVDKLIREICRRDPRPLTQRSTAIPLQLDEIFDRCCAKKARDRYSSADELANQVARVIEELEASEGRSSYGGQLSHNPLSPRASGSEPGNAASWMQSGAAGISQAATPRGQDSLSTSTQPSSRVSGRHAAPVPALWLWMGGLAVVVGIASAAGVLYGLNRGNLGKAPVVAQPADIEGLVAVADAGDLTPPNERRDGDDDLEIEQDRPPESTPPVIPMVKPDPPSIDYAKLSVSPDGSGTHLTISDALRDVEDGGEIRIAPGYYSESLQISKTVHLLGAKDRGQVEIQSEAGPCLLMMGGHVVAERLTLRGLGIKGRNEFNAIDLINGSVQLDDCVITASTFNCIKARQGTALTLANSTFSTSSDSAISCVDTEPVKFQNCVFRNCFDAAIELIGCTGQIVGCEFLGNTQYGIYCERTGQTPVLVKQCSIDGCTVAGIRAVSEGQIDVQGGKLTRCMASVQTEAGKISLQGVTIADSMQMCFGILEDGLLQATDCELRTSLLGVAMTQGAADLTDCKISQMKRFGVYAREGSRLSLNNCVIEKGFDAGIEAHDSQLTIVGGRISENPAGGLFVSGPKGTLKAERVAIEDNAAFGFQQIDGEATFTAGSIANSRVGVIVKHNQQSVEPAKFVADRLTLRDNRELGFSFDIDTKADLRGCTSSGHPPNQALQFSPQADVTLDEACDLR